jgi:hypothetical protein
LAELGKEVGFSSRKKSMPVTESKKILEDKESYKFKGISILKNPLDAPNKNELAAKMQMTAPTLTNGVLFNTNTEFLSKGISEAEAGIPRASNYRNLVGHASLGEKNKILC